MNDLTAAQKDLLFRVETKPELQPFFFREVKGLEWFEPLYQGGFFSPDQNPTPIPAKEEGYVQIPSWPASEYLVATSPNLQEPKNEKYAKKFLEIIRGCTEYAIAENYGNYRTWWQFAKIIRNIPPKLITVADLEFVGYWLKDPYERGLVAEELGENWLVQLLNANDTHCDELAVKLLEKLYAVEIKDLESGFYENKEAVLPFDHWRAKKITSSVAKEVGRKLGLVATEMSHQLLVNLLEELKNDRWSSIWRPAIEDHEQNHGSDDADNILIQLFRDSLIGFVERSPTDAGQYIVKLLEGKYETVKRVAIYVIGQNYHKLDSLVDQILNNQFFKANFRHELWHLLNKNYTHFNQWRQKTLTNLITRLATKDDDGNLNEKASAYEKAIWLSSVKEYDVALSKQYRDYVRIAGAEPDHPDFSSYMSGGWVEQKSPFDIDELRALEIDDLVTKLNSFEDSGQFGEPSIRGLAKCFKDLVKGEPLRFYLQLDKFRDSDVSFVYEIIEAYRELWNEKKKNIPWDDVWNALLHFCQKLAQSAQFWSAENANQGRSFVANRHWIVGAVGHLIEDGTKSDEHAFNTKLLGVAKHVLLMLLEKQEGEEFKNDSDAVFVAINSPRGRCIEALINLSLRSCRLAGKSVNGHAEVWQEFEAIYDAELSLSNKGVYEFATLVANYLPNFLYMSPKWVNNNLEKIFNQQNYQQWLCAIQGYSYVRTIYQEVYKYLKNNGDFIRALDDESVKGKVQERVIQNIVIAYINDDEILNDRESLISMLMDRKNYEEIRQIIWFIWTLRKDEDERLKAKVFELWPKLLSLIDLGIEEGKKLASQLSHWSAFVERIDASNRSLLLSIAPYADEDHNSYELLKNLAELSNEQPFEAHEIWIKMLEGCTPDYPEEAIEQLLNNLVGVGSEGIRKAKEAVDAYLKRGNDGPERYLRKKL